MPGRTNHFFVMSFEMYPSPAGSKTTPGAGKALSGILHFVRIYPLWWEYACCQLVVKLLIFAYLMPFRLSADRGIQRETSRAPARTFSWRLLH